MRHPSSNRSGFTLIETLTYMFAAVTILALAIQLIHSSLGISKAASRQWQQDSTLARLTRDFRRDLQAATKIEFQNDSKILILSTEQTHSIQWNLEADQTPSGEPIVRRIELEKSGERDAAEAYILTVGTKAVLNQLASSSEVELRITTSPTNLPQSEGEVFEKLVRTIRCSTKSTSGRIPVANATDLRSTAAEKPQ